MNIPSVIVALVLFGVCVPMMLTAHARGAAAAWNAAAEQQAAAVAAWYTAAAAADGCPPPPIPPVERLLPDDARFLPHAGFTVTCTAHSVPWPPPPADPGRIQFRRVDVTVAWERLNGATRILPFTTLSPP